MPDLRDKREIIEYLRSIVLMPLNIIFYYTIPDCKQERFRNWYMITFGMSILWLAILSYFMIWMVIYKMKITINIIQFIIYYYL